MAACGSAWNRPGRGAHRVPGAWAPFRLIDSGSSDPASRDPFTVAVSIGRQHVSFVVKSDASTQPVHPARPARCSDCPGTPVAPAPAAWGTDVRQPAGRPGFFGKLPARGDFVGRRLDQAFRTGFDDWLQRSIATSKRQLGRPGCRPTSTPRSGASCSAPACAASLPTAGVMMPSVDRVGRYFPLVLAAQLPGCLSPGTLFHSGRAWFDAAEQLILTSLDDDFDFDSFDATWSRWACRPTPRAGEAAAPRLRLDLDGTATCRRPTPASWTRC